MRPLFIFALILLAVCALGAAGPASIYDYSMNRIDGTPESLSRYRGQVVMIVNVASRCGNTPQYEGLEALYEKYRDRGFVVLGFPANDFGRQEPGTNEEIADYCRATWGVKFPMFEKISVKGDGKHPLYAFLTSRSAPIGGEIDWNFQKFLVSRDGRVVERISSSRQPQAKRVVEKIEALLMESTRP